MSDCRVQVMLIFVAFYCFVFDDMTSEVLGTQGELANCADEDNTIVGGVEGCTA